MIYFCEQTNMDRFIQTIAFIFLAGLLALNPAAGAAVDAAPCPPHLCCGAAMDQGHHNGMLNFAVPSQGCCDNCNDGFCDLLDDPLQEVNAVHSSPFQGPHASLILGAVSAFGQSSLRASASDIQHPLLELRTSGQIPRYLENLALII